MDVFAHDSYKTLIQEKVAENKLKGLKNSTFQALADHCRMQKTYVSKVLNHEGDFTEDQLFLACEFLGLAGADRDYALLLRSHEISTVQSRRREMRVLIDAYRQNHLRSEANTQVEIPHVTAERQRYYLDPLYSIIHMLLTVERFNGDVEHIANALRIPRDQAQSYLESLEKMRIIKFVKSRYQVLEDHIHLKEDSPLVSPYRALMRLKGIERVSGLKPEQAYSFSVVFSADEKVRMKIRAEFMSFLKKTQLLVKSAKSEDVYQLNFDLFGWT